MPSAPDTASNRKGTGRAEFPENSALEPTEACGEALPQLSGTGHSFVDILEGIADGFCAFDREWCVTCLNKAAERIFGLSRSEMLGRSYWELFPAVRGTATEEAYLRAVRDRMPVEFEIWYESRQCWYCVRACPILDGGLSVFFHDISERKNIEEEQHRTHALLTTILDSSPDVIAAKDREGRYLALNEATAQIIGRPVEEIIGRTDEEITTREVAEPIMAVDRELMRTGKAVSVDEQYPDPSGCLHFFQSVKAPLRDEAGTPVGIVVVSRDVTRQKHAEAALLKSEEEFRTLADNISQLAWMADESGSIFWYNHRWYDYTGTTLEAMRGWGWQTIHHPEHVERVVAYIKHCFEMGEIWEDTFPLPGKDGTYRWFLSRALSIRNAENRIIRWFGTNTDITQRLEIERELRLANADLEQFAYSASHDLQEPLRGVSIYSELLVARHSDQLDDEAREFLKYLRNGALRMEMLVRDLLAYTQVRKLDAPLEKIDANAALKAVLSDLAQPIAQSEAQITSNMLPGLPVHSSHLQQLFQNLIGNALKYCGGRRPVVHVEARQQNRCWLFSVKDNGIGIDFQYKEKIFGLFKRLHTSEEYPGTGIGLAICQRIVEQYHGRIWVESRPGEGSTFYFTLY